MHCSWLFQVSRRPARVGAAAVAALSVVAFGQATTNYAHAQKQSLEISWSGGNIGRNLKKVFVDPYDKNVDIKVVNSFDSRRFTLLNANRAKPTIDLGTFIDVMFPIVERSNLLEKMSTSEIPNLKDIYPQLVKKSGLGAAYMFGAWGIVYNADAVKKPITSWADLVREDLKGRVTSPAITYLSAVFVLDAMARLNGGDLKSYEKGLEMMRKIRLNGPGFWRNDSIAIGWIKTGEVWATPFYSGNMISLQGRKDMPKLRFVVPKEGAYMVASNVVKVKNGPNPKVADKFINTMLSVEAQERWAKIGGSRPANRKAKVPKAVLESVPNPEKLLVIDSEFFVKNRQAIIDRWNAVVNR